MTHSTRGGEAGGKEGTRPRFLTLAPGKAKELSSHARMEIRQIKIRASSTGDRCRLASDPFRGIGSSYAIPRVEARRDGEPIAQRDGMGERVKRIL